MANKDLTELRWIGAHHPDYARHMASIAGNNPGARFIAVYRPIEEVARSWEKDADDHLDGDNRFERAVKTWNRNLQSVRRFIRNCHVPRVLLISYHDVFQRPETVVPLISRFLAFEFEESPVAVGADELVRPEKALSEEERSSIQEHSNHAAEAWILDRIERQWEKPALYAQETSKTALAAYLDEMEAETWLLRQKVRELERVAMSLVRESS